MCDQKLLDPWLGSFQNICMRYFVSRCLYRKPFQWRLWTELGCIPDSLQDELREARKAGRTWRDFGEQCEKLEKWTAKLFLGGSGMNETWSEWGWISHNYRDSYLCVLCDSIEQHCNDGTSQSLIVSTQRMNQQSRLIWIDVVFDLLVQERESFATSDCIVVSSRQWELIVCATWALDQVGNECDHLVKWHRAALFHRKCIVGRILVSVRCWVDLKMRYKL